MIVFMAIGYVPLWFAYHTRRPGLRVLLCLFAALYLPICGSLLLLAGSADSIQGGPIPVVMMVLAVICGLSAIGAVVLARRPMARDDTTSDERR